MELVDSEEKPGKKGFLELMARPGKEGLLDLMEQVALVDWLAQLVSEAKVAKVASAAAAAAVVVEALVRLEVTPD